jgi:putative heme-binding domain-containing protein
MLSPGQGAPRSLEQDLLTEDAAVLANKARSNGDPSRGAIVFFQPHMTCTKCHSTGKADMPLGPDLAHSKDKITAQHLVESVLQPNKVVKKGFESIVVATDDGLTITGLLVSEKPGELVLRDIQRDGKLVTIDKDSIEAHQQNRLSIMPAGLVNQLTSRQQFLDLISYLIEITEKGPLRAAELEPAPALYAARPLPEYEKHVDHAGMIASLDESAFKRGKAIYEQLCINCHGTQDEPGSLPTSLKFAGGNFKNGSDPHSMYQTLTKGFGMMVAQSWMVPQQKYDVIHYIRQAYLKPHNMSQLFTVNDGYLASLPKGDTRGPEPSVIELWSLMDYGRSLISTYEIGSDALNFAYKGIAIRLDPGPGGVSHGRDWMIFDHDTLRVAAGWSGAGFIDWNSIMFNGRHRVHPRIVGQVQFGNPTGPGWANPKTGNFEDPRLLGRDDRPYGPLPRDWAHYKGLYHHGDDTIVSYTVGDTSVLEMLGQAMAGDQAVFTRTFNIGPRSRDMILRVANLPDENVVRSLKIDTQQRGSAVLFGPNRTSNNDAASAEKANGDSGLIAGVSNLTDGSWSADDGSNLCLTLPAGKDPLRFTLWLSRVDQPNRAAALADALVINEADRDLSTMLKGGPARWSEKVQTVGLLGADDGPFAVDVLTRPASNPWNALVRLTGLDFFADGHRAAVSAWDGDVWLVTGIDQPQQGLTWQRIASGLFQPLGVRVIEEKIHVTCRDQLVILHDLNGDGETDFYESFNNDHQVTEHFHEFAMGLQTDDEGNFYYAKSARHAKTALVPHHGTLLRVSKDGSQTKILAKGFRAANGICLNPDGTFIVTDQEGHWNPKNRINYVKEGGFYGNMYGYHDVTDSSDSAMEQPLCWITNAFDRSPGELLWVDSERWGPLNGTLLNLSYGNGKVFVVPHEKIDGQAQGGMCQLPIPQFPTGVMRGRFHPGDGQLYVCGMFAWAGDQQQPGGFYRLRYTGKSVFLPIGLEVTKRGLAIDFSGELDPKAASAVENYAVKTWELKRTANYGSKHYNEKPLEITKVTLRNDRRTVLLELPDIEPVWSMEIRYAIKGADGASISGVIHNTIHKLRE